MAPEVNQTYLRLLDDNQAATWLNSSSNPDVDNKDDTVKIHRLPQCETKVVMNRQDPQTVVGVAIISACACAAERSDARRFVGAPARQP